MIDTSLDKLDIDKSATISTLNCNGNLRRRLLDLGLIEGTHIKPVLISPSGDPRAFEFRGSLIAIREEDAENIKLK